MSDMTFAVGAAGTLVVAVGAYSVRVARFGRARDVRLNREGDAGSASRFLKEAVHWALRTIVADFTPRWVTPDALTVVGLLMTIGCIPLAASGLFGGTALLLLGASAFDVVDGVVARSRHVASQAGEMLDAVVDRYADVAPLSGLALFYRESSVALGTVLFVMVGALMVSYVRAKAESSGLDLPSGTMRRPERVAFLIGALVLGSIFPLDVAGVSRAPTLALLLLVGVLSHRDALVLLRQARAQLRVPDLIIPDAPGHSLRVDYTPGQGAAHLLMRCPACPEPWMVATIRGDPDGNVMWQASRVAAPVCVHDFPVILRRVWPEVVSRLAAHGLTVPVVVWSDLAWQSAPSAEGR